MVARAVEKDIEITTDIQENVSLCNDQEKILQVITILADNAIKYSELNGSINISLVQKNKKVYVMVTNSGKGIKESEIQNIFDRFYQTEPSRNSKNGGFGLGLSIAKSLTEKLGGKLMVESRENDKTTFTFFI